MNYANSCAIPVHDNSPYLRTPIRCLIQNKICRLNDTCICLRQEICYTIFSNKQTSSISKYLYRKCYAEPYLTERNFSTTQKTKFSFKVGFSPSKKTLFLFFNENYFKNDEK